MKLRTPEDLFDITTKDLAWRKKELFSLRSMLLTSDFPEGKKSVLLRSAIALTYAHWEGFIKAAATAYINFVAMQRLKHNELAPNFLALAIRPVLMSAFQSKKIFDHMKIVNFFLNELASQSSLTYKGIVDTESNLSTAVLKNIVTTLGFDYAVYEGKEKLIDEKLLRTRNNIAHGEFILVDEEDAFEIQDQCIEMMELFRNQVDNAATLYAYKSRI